MRAKKPRVPTVHREIYVGERHRDTIAVSCVCPIGKDHTFAEWREQHAVRRTEPAASARP